MQDRYLRMIRRRAESAAAAVEPPEWSVYVVRCADGSLYTGIAKNVEARIALHNTGRGAAYTRSRRPVRLRYAEPGFTRSEALVREAKIKSLPRDAKARLGGGLPD